MGDLELSKDAAALKIQSCWRGFKGHRTAALVALVVAATDHEDERQRKELERQAMQIKWDRARQRLKMQTKMKLRRQKRLKELHSKMDGDSSSSSAAVIQNLWRMNQKHKEAKEEEERIKNERRRLKKKLQVKLARNRRLKTEELHESMSHQEDVKAALLFQSAWRARKGRIEAAKLRRESGLSRDELLERWERAAFRLRAQKAMKQRRESRYQLLRARMAKDAADDSEKKGGLRRQMSLGWVKGKKKEKVKFHESDF